MIVSVCGLVLFEVSFKCCADVVYGEKGQRKANVRLI